jgi:hypothetical protein
VILAELMFGRMIVAAVVLLLLPFLLIMAGVGVAVLLWLMGRPLCWAACSSGWPFPTPAGLRS